MIQLIQEREEKKSDMILSLFIKIRLVSTNTLSIPIK